MRKAIALAVIAILLVACGGKTRAQEASPSIEPEATSTIACARFSVPEGWEDSIIEAFEESLIEVVDIIPCPSDPTEAVDFIPLGQKGTFGDWSITVKSANVKGKIATVAFRLTNESDQAFDPKYSVDVSLWSRDTGDELPYKGEYGILDQCILDKASGNDIPPGRGVNFKCLYTVPKGTKTSNLSFYGSDSSEYQEFALD